MQQKIVDLQASPPPPAWGVKVDPLAISELANQWAKLKMPLPEFSYSGTPRRRPKQWWFTYVSVAVSVMACLWPQAGRQMWATRYKSQTGWQWLEDAPGIFAVFSRQLQPEQGLDLNYLAKLSQDQGRQLFAGKGDLQLLDQRIEQLRNLATALIERWDGNALNLVLEADGNAQKVAELLTATLPGYKDQPVSSVGTLPFNKLSYLASAIMAAGSGWSFSHYEGFPVYPDYMLPRVLRHLGALSYQSELAQKVDQAQLIAANSDAEHAIRWATVYAGALLKKKLNQLGNPVSAPGLDYHLWYQSVLGPKARQFGQHHRTITMSY